MLSIMHWLCLEHGTESTMLKNAFLSMKGENSKWLNKVEDLLWKIGLREVRLNPHQWDKKVYRHSSHKGFVILSFQKYTEYLDKESHLEKCTIVRLKAILHYA